MTLNRFKLIAIAFFLLPLVAILLFRSGPVMAVNAAADEPSVTYKANALHAIVRRPKSTSTRLWLRRSL